MDSLHLGGLRCWEVPEDAGFSAHVVSTCGDRCVAPAALRRTVWEEGPSEQPWEDPAFAVDSNRSAAPHGEESCADGVPGRRLPAQTLSPPRAMTQCWGGGGAGGSEGSQGGTRKAMPLPLPALGPPHNTLHPGLQALPRIREVVYFFSLFLAFILIKFM